MRAGGCPAVVALWHCSECVKIEILVKNVSDLTLLVKRTQIFNLLYGGLLPVYIYIYKKIKRCRGGMPETMQTR